MKIVHVEDYFDPTAGYQINELLLASKEFNDEVFLITSKDMSPFHKTVHKEKDNEFEKKTGVKIYRLDSVFKLSTRLVLKDLKQTIKKINPDLVFMHGIGDFKDLQLWTKKESYKLVRDCHMSWVASKNRLRRVYYFFYKIFFATIINNTIKYEKIYALGEEEYEYLRKIGINDKKIDYLKHGYNESIMYYDEAERQEIRNKYGFNEKDIVISYIGKFDYSKRPDIVIDILDKFKKDYIKRNHIKLLFIGPKDEIYMQEFNEKLQVIKTKIDVTLDESKSFSELRKYYSATDICIFPKETSLSSIHAQVCGCPVIMENHKSNQERVMDNSTLFEINNINQAVIILENIIQDKRYIKKNNDLTSLAEREYSNQINKLRDLFEK